MGPVSATYSLGEQLWTIRYGLMAAAAPRATPLLLCFSCKGLFLLPSCFLLSSAEIVSEKTMTRVYGSISQVIACIVDSSFEHAIYFTGFESLFKVCTIAHLSLFGTEHLAGRV